MPLIFFVSWDLSHEFTTHRLFGFSCYEISINLAVRNILSENGDLASGMDIGTPATVFCGCGTTGHLNHCYVFNHLLGGIDRRRRARTPARLVVTNPS